MLRADDDAGGLEPYLDAMTAEVTLRGSLRLRVDVDSVIRTRLHAALAADTHVFVELDDAIAALIHRRGGTDAHARRVLTVIAAGDLKVTLGVGKEPCLCALDPGAIDPQGHLVFGLTGGAACVATYALAILDDEAEVGFAATPGRGSNTYTHVN